MRSRPAVLIALLIALLLGGGSIYTLVKSSTDPDSGHGRGTFDPTANSEEGNPDDDDVGNEFSIDPNSSSDGETGEGESPTSAEPDSPPDPNALAEASEAPVEYRIEGTVVAADGRELPSVSVRLYRHRTTEEKGGAFEQLIDSLGEGADGAGSPTAGSASIGAATTDRFGRFSIAVDSPGEYRLSASLPPLAQGIEGPFRLTERDPQLDLLIVLGGGLSIEGIVEGPSGRAVAGAEVSLLDRLEGELPGRHYHAHKTRTATDGTFRFDGLEGRRYILTATIDGLARTLIPAVTPPENDLHVSLAEGRSLVVRVIRGYPESTSRYSVDGRSGNVVDGEFPMPTIPRRPIDGEGEPVAGAKVYALNPAGFAIAETDANGIATLAIEGEDASLRIMAPGYREGRVRRIVLPDDDDLTPQEVAIAPVVPIDGVVLRSDGTPAPHADLLEIGFGLMGSGIETLTADAEGRFQYSGSGSLIARHDGEVSALDARGSGPSPTIQLEPTMTVTGRLVSADGWPAVGAEVRLSLRGLDGGGGDSILHWTGLSTSTITGADGVFYFSAVPPWRNMFEVVIYADGSPDLHLPIANDLGDITLGLEAVLSGTIRTPEGTAPAAAALILELPGEPAVRRDTTGVLRGGERVLVASDGSFYINRLAATAGDPLVFYVVAPPYLEERRTITLVSGENGPLDIELREGGVARVVVENSDGTPRVAASVQIRRGSQTAPRTAYTGPDGSVQFAGLAPASYTVAVDVGSDAAMGTVEIVAGELREVVLELE